MFISHNNMQKKRFYLACIDKIYKKNYEKMKILIGDNYIYPL